MRTLIVTSVAVVATLAARAGADPAASRVYTGLAFDTTLVSKLGLEHGLGDLRPRLAPAVVGELIMPVFEPGGGDGEVRAGLRGVVAGGGRFTLGVALLPHLRTTRNQVHRAVGLGVDLELAPQLELGRWALAVELGYSRSLLLHLTHTQAYRDRVYADAVDGWYQGGAGTVRAGARAGVRLGRVTAQLRGGVTRTDHGDAELVPFYGEAGVALRF
jgi:hypothetical protein